MLRIIHNATPETIRFERKTAEGSVSQIHEREDPTSICNLSRPITLKVVSFVLCAAAIASASVGQYHPFGVLVGTMVFHNVATMSSSNSNIRRLLKLCSILTVRLVMTGHGIVHRDNSSYRSVLRPLSRSSSAFVLSSLPKRTSVPTRRWT